jgi:methylase of polypeptide subunit release factors
MRVNGLLTSAGWPTELIEETLASSAVEAVFDEIGTHVVVRLVGHAALSVSLVSADTKALRVDALRRWAGNAAYNRHARIGAWLDFTEAGELLLPRWVETVAHGDSKTNSVLAMPYCATRFSAHHTAELEGTLAPHILATNESEKVWTVAARAAGYRCRPMVDRLLLTHCLKFRSTVLRVDTAGNMTASERSHFDAALVLLMTRLLFVRHLEDRSIGNWRRGILANVVATSERCSELVAEIFAELHREFNSELFPASSSAAYRMPAVPQSALREFILGLYEQPKAGVSYNFQLLESDSLGLLYQQFAGVRWPGDELVDQLRILGKEPLRAETVREQLGIFYTPPAVVDTILELTLGAWTRENQAKDPKFPRVVDLTVGSGVFLSRGFDYFMRSQPSTENARAREWVEHLHGCDIDARAIALARLNLWMAFAKYFDQARLPSLANTVRVADSLAEPQELAQHPESIPPLPESWRATGFDIVIGNPPFLGHRDAVAAFGPRRVATWRMRHRSATKEVNLSSLFVERAMRLLRPGGYLGMVVPRNLLKTESGESLRRLIRNTCDVITVIDCLDAPLFVDASTHAAIIILQRPRAGRGSKARISVGLIVSDASPDAFAPLAVARHLPIGTSSVRQHNIDLPHERELLLSLSDRNEYEPAWMLEDKVGRSLLERIHAASDKRLGDLAKSWYAVDEGARGVFFLRNLQPRGKGIVRAWSRALSADVELESNLIRQAIPPTRIRVFGYYYPHGESADSADGILYPYDQYSGEVVSWEKIQEIAPLTARYLSGLRTALTRRRGHGAADGWWVPRAVRKRAPWHTPRSSKPFILVSRHGLWPRATLVSPDVIPVGGAIIWETLPSSLLAPETFLALASSRLWWWYVVGTGSIGRGKHYRIRPGVWDVLNVPNALCGQTSTTRKIVAGVRRLVSAVDPETISRQWSEIDRLVEDSYLLTATERDHLASVLETYTALQRDAWIRKRLQGHAPAVLSLFGKEA